MSIMTGTGLLWWIGTALVLLVAFPLVVNADVVLDRKTMDLTLTAAELSALAYVPNPSSDGYDMLKSFIHGAFMSGSVFECCYAS